jgi:hypothetical protein
MRTTFLIHRSLAAAFCDVVIALGLAVLSASAHAELVFAGQLNDPANAALAASDLTAPQFASPVDVANNVALLTFTVGLAGSVEVRSTGFAAGGVDPFFSLFQGTGPTATFLASNYDQAFSTGGDFDYVGLLATGAYTIALGTFANESFAENYGSGTLADGFIGLGTESYLGDSSYRLSVTSLPVTAPVPEPTSAALLLIGMAALFARRRHMQRVGYVGKFERIQS